MKYSGLVASDILRRATRPFPEWPETFGVSVKLETLYRGKSQEDGVLTESAPVITVVDSEQLRRAFGEDAVLKSHNGSPYRQRWINAVRTFTLAYEKANGAESTKGDAFVAEVVTDAVNRVFLGLKAQRIILRSADGTVHETAEAWKVYEMAKLVDGGMSADIARQVVEIQFAKIEPETVEDDGDSTEA